MLIAHTRFLKDIVCRRILMKKKSEPDDFEYDVAISFAGEDRKVASRIAELLIPIPVPTSILPCHDDEFCFRGLRA